MALVGKKPDAEEKAPGKGKGAGAAAGAEKSQDAKLKDLEERVAALEATHAGQLAGVGPN